MKKYGLRVLVGLIAFGVGVSAVIWKLSQPIAYDFISKETVQIEPEQTKFYTLSNKTDPKLKIEVHFKEFKKTKDGLIAVVKVKNNSTISVYYKLVEDNKYPHPLFKFNDVVNENAVFICGYSTITSKRINSGESNEFKTVAYLLEKYLNESGGLQIGYSFWKDGEKESQIYWSEQIIIPDWVKDEIGKEKLRK